MSDLMAIMLQGLAARPGIAGRRDLAQDEETAADQLRHRVRVRPDVETNL